MKKKIIPLLILLLSPTLYAESILTLEMQILQSIGYDKTEEEWVYSGSGSADLVVKSTGNKNVKGELSLEYIPVETTEETLTLTSLDKASLKVQFPSLRITMGKTRIGWGEGFVFNSGDVLYGSLDPSVDLTSDEVRSDTALLTLIRYSRGRSYAETILMPASLETDDYVTYTQPDITATSAGGRVVTALGGADLELGYLCKGQEKSEGDMTGHRPYLSFHGYGKVDWYGSASLAIPFEEADWEENTNGTVNISTGAYRQFGLGYNGTISFRLETLLYPWGEWAEQSQADSYALYLYPEISIDTGRNLTLPLLAILSPVDQSGQISLSADWNVYQGFSFQGYLVGEIGGGNDTFQTGNASFTGGMTYKY
jgi:hypothetical protein